MTQTNKINQITDFLSTANLTWLLPNLRQDFVVWKSLNDPKIFEQLIHQNPPGFDITPQHFSPSRLALLVLEQNQAMVKAPGDVLESINPLVLQSAIRYFNGQSFFDTNPLNITNASLIALALASQYHSTHSWNGLINTIQDRPGALWSAPLACLYGMVYEPDSLFISL